LKKISFILLSILFIFISPALSGSGIIVLSDKNEEYFLNQDVVEVFEDINHKYTIEDISLPEFQSRFTRLKTYHFENDKPGAAYWIKFTVKNLSPEKDWLFESFNYKVNLLELYSPLENGKFKVERQGYDFEFDNRILNHKNFEFFLTDLGEKEKTFYLKVVCKDSQRTRMLIRSHSKFVSYALNEYFLLGLFYGMIVIIVIYNLFLYTRLKDISYLFYALYVIFMGLFSMVQDGLGFQYIWPGFPKLNPHALFLFSTGMVIFLLLYSRSFLDTKNQFPTLHKIIFYVIIARISIFFIEFFFVPQFVNFIWIDIIPYLIAYLISIVAYIRKNDSAFYFVAGFTILFIGFTFNTLRIFKVIPSNLFTVYILNIATLIEMILLSLALSERVKKINENEMIKEQINKELEEKVRERTEAIMIQKNIIEEKVNALDTFIYKASHDIKGPLKSLIGITTLGMKDTPENSRIYFEHALKTTKKLDAIVKDLLHIGRISNKRGELEEIRFREVIHDILESLKSGQNYEKINFNIQIEEKSKFFSEKSLIYSIIQNLIENAIKYRDTKKKKSFLNIKVNITPITCELEFTDNGIGIPEQFQNKVFEMFFKMDYSSDDSTGLGLYIVKLSVEKLGGQLFMNSKQGEGTTFKILFKNKSASPAPLFNPDSFRGSN
jgi:signal transduction histidine kinase